jgi:hypothetical protein
MRVHGYVLPAPSSHENDLPSLYWQKRRKNYHSKTSQEALPLGQTGRTSKKN